MCFILYASENYSFILFYFTVLRRHSLVLAFVSSLIGAMLFYYYILCNVNTMSYNWREHVAITLIQSLLVLSFRGNCTNILCKINQKERVYLCPNLICSEEGKGKAFSKTVFSLISSIIWTQVLLLRMKPLRILPMHWCYHTQTPHDHLYVPPVL